MKKLTSLLLCLLLIVSFSPAVSAEYPRIIDEAGLLTDDQIMLLENKAEKLTNQYGMEVVILTVDRLGQKESDEFADDYFDDYGYGIGPDGSGLLLLLSMEYRDWAISTCGEAIYAVTDYAVYEIFSEIAPDLSADRYYEAFDLYLDTLDTYLYSYSQGRPVDGTIGDYYGPETIFPPDRDDVVYYPDKLTAGEVFKILLISLVIGCIAGGVVLLILRAGMKTAKRQSGATDYMHPGSFDLYRRQDIFLYSRVSKVRRDTDSGGSRSGGSSIHRSSSGRSHGGGRGKF